MNLKKTLERLAYSDRTAFIRRVMWIDLDRRIHNVFESEIANVDSTQWMGSLYIWRLSEIDQYCNSRIPTYRRQNATYIHTGTRLLGTTFINTRKGKNGQERTIATAYEGGAQIWFTQTGTGEVVVSVAPYKSNLGSVEEKDFVLQRYKEPIQVSERKIRKHLKTYYRYCAATSQNNAFPLITFLFRQKLKYEDFRYRSEFHQKLLNFGERLLKVLIPIILLAITYSQLS